MQLSSYEEPRDPATSYKALLSSQRQRLQGCRGRQSFHLGRWTG